MYCVYLTIYSGNKLPPFYVGYTTEEKLVKGYVGTIRSKVYEKVFNEELKNNPHLFKTFIISRRKERSEALKRESQIQRFFSVHKNPMFINKAISNEKFYCEDHSFKRTESYSKKVSENNQRTWQDPEIRRKRTEGMKKTKATEEYRKKQSERSRKQAADPNYIEKLSSGVKASWDRPGERERRGKIRKEYYRNNQEAKEKLTKKRWWNNGETAVHQEECPPGFVSGRGSYWTNGEENILALKCPVGFWRGLTKSPKS